MAFNFLSVFIRFAKNQFAILITRRLQPLVLKIHKKASQYNCTQWVRFAPFRETHCYSGYEFSYKLKNNFAILNLVKSFLTSITFDSLSRKIKNPCLVINFKFIFKEDTIMRVSQKFLTYVVVGALVMALFVSCKNDDKTGGDAGKFKHSVLAGTWRNGENSFTIDSSGYVNFTYNSRTYNGKVIDMEGESYEDAPPAGSVYSGDYLSLAAFRFTSSSSCEVKVDERNKDNQILNTTPLGTFTK